MLHGVAMPKECLRVSVDEVVEDNAVLPFPVSDEMGTVGSALASHVAWPEHFVVLKDEIHVEEQTLEKVVRKKEVKQKEFTEKLTMPFSSLPPTLKALYRLYEKSVKDGQGLHLSLVCDIFGVDISIWIMWEDVIPFCDLEPITGNCILGYLLHLYKKLKESGKSDRFMLANPFGISYTHKQPRDDRARKLADRLLSATSEQLVLVPCNVGQHWILTIIVPHKNRVHLMDPLSHRNRDTTWKYVVDTAMSIVNANQGKNFKKGPTWEIIKGPIQPDYKQCGVYVMRFLKEIIEGFENDESFSISSLFQKEEYSQDQIDEVREEWATCVMDEIDF